MFGTNIHLQNTMSSIRAKETELKSTIECLMDALQNAECRDTFQNSRKYEQSYGGHCRLGDEG
jgi:hypothetical protein